MKKRSYGRLKRSVYTQTEYKKNFCSNKIFDNRTSSNILLRDHLLHRLHIFVLKQYRVSSASASVC